MPNSKILKRGLSAVIAGSLLVLGGCAEADYLNHRDTVTLAAGNAVRQNVEMETTNPTAGYMYDTSGLGADGSQQPPKQ